MMKKIIPAWQCSTNVRAFTTTRMGGVSLPPFESFNLATHVGDEKNSVETNRTLLVQQGQLPHMPAFLQQVHSTKVIRLPEDLSSTDTPIADAVYTCQPNQVCLVMTADCLPVLLVNQQGNEVAAVHAGWRGLCEGILENTLAKFQSNPTQILAWLGPAISQNAFQVGEEVRQQFVQRDPQAALAFKQDKSAVGNQNKFLADLYLLAKQRLNALGVSQITGGEYCTYRQAEHFFSYRRKQQTGRMASLIWFEPS
ncbi:hypothetical protein EV694_0954 [Volucribacter psittacicida]|uniref:Purine nucleoside phosphorylase n=2 Tax=Volucribacter psittacicida TaxID=203482 RepID=A0A4V2PBS5_9PAST|nr:hypothetical protein EV694_0954 [Volucribacter psittacicida]